LQYFLEPVYLFQVPRARVELTPLFNKVEILSINPTRNYPTSGLPGKRRAKQSIARKRNKFVTMDIGSVIKEKVENLYALKKIFTMTLAH
ncbi:3220_t:CDS:1, partial [Paraglomus occultum]